MTSDQQVQTVMEVVADARRDVDITTQTLTKVYLHTPQYQPFTVNVRYPSGYLESNCVGFEFWSHSTIIFINNITLLDSNFGPTLQLFSQITVH